MSLKALVGRLNVGHSIKGNSMNRVSRQVGVGRIMILSTMALLLPACASATVYQMQEAPASALKPDVVVVYDFDVTPSEIQLDRGLAPQIARELGGNTQSQEEAQAGRLVADSLSAKLVAKLNDMGISASRASNRSVRITDRSLLLKGYFLHVDQGDQNLRAVVGFGFGGSQVDTHVMAFQNGKVVADAYTTTESGLKPGLAVSAVGGVSSLVVGTGTTAFSETFTATVEADAKRTADQLAEKIRKAYVKRGWLPQ
jgi:hypothetical protein